MKKFIFIAVAVVLLALAPLGVKNIIDEEVSKQSLLLEKKGLKVEVLSSNGYLKTKRDFELTIEDEKKFKEFLRDSFVEKYPTYEALFDSIVEEDTKEFDEFLRGLVFKGDISNSNINYNSDIDVYVYLHKFSDEIMSELNRNKDKNQEVLSLLNKKALAFDINLTNKAKLKRIALKDIDERVVSKNSLGHTSDTTFKVLSYFFENKSTQELLKGKLNLDKFLIQTSKENENSIMDLTSLVYNFTYLNEYINSSDLKLKEFSFLVDGVNVDINNLDLKSKGLVKSGIYRTQLDLKTDDFRFLTPADKFTIESILLNIDFNNIDYERLRNLNSSYINLELISLDKTLTKNERSQKLSYAVETLINDIDEVLNYGATLKANLDLKALDSRISFETIDLDIDLTLQKNNLTFQTLNKKELLSNIDGTINIVLPKKDFMVLLKEINSSIGMLLSVYAKEEKNQVLFNIDIKNGEIFVNDKKLN